MKVVAFYITNYGFGHASRNIPIMEKLLRMDDELRIIVKTHTKQLKFIRQSLDVYNSRIVYCDESVDMGLILKAGSYLVDKEKLRDELVRFISTWDERVEKEKLFLKEEGVQLVISDIVPWIFEASHQLKIRSIAISNFTWDQVYDDLLHDRSALLYEDCYKKADYVFEYPLAKHVILNHDHILKIGLSCREFSDEAIREIKARFKKPLVYVSLGRSVNMNQKINVEDLPYDFVYTAGIKLKGSNAHQLSTDAINTQDYIKASELVITKAGWSTVAEAICARKPMLVMSRPEITEDRDTVNHLFRMKIAKLIYFSQLNSVDLKIAIEEGKKLEGNYEFLDDRYQDESIEIAKEILKLIK